MFRIDAHHHLWQYSEAEYPWISENMQVLRHDFTPDNLHVETRHAGIDYSIAVQARQIVAETEFLLAAAAKSPFIRGVVGWVPLTSPKVEDDLSRLAANPTLRGVRHVLQDESDEQYMLRADFNRGIKSLHQFDLTYDILIFERHLPQTIKFVDQHPNQRFVVDHLAKPRVRAQALEPWRSHIAQLAERPNVYCKLSGLATEADHRRWSPEQLKTYMDVVLNVFTPSRVMFGSDWPVCLLAISYSHWVELVTAEIAQLSPFEQARIWGGTAAEAYGLRLLD